MKGLLPTVGWVILALALLVSFGVDFENTAQGGAIDLRNRITGARLLAHAIDPYHYKWHEPEPEIYCDFYNNPNLPVSKTTATPALLMLHLPLAVLPYRLAQFLWFFCQWLLLGGTAWLWMQRCATHRERWLLALFFTGFTYTAAWRLHAERGQAYILLAFLFAWWLTATLDSKKSAGFVAGFLAGLLIALRPPFLLLAPFLVMRCRGQWIGAAVGLLLGIGLPMFLQPTCWWDYLAAMQTDSQLYRAGTDNPHYQQPYPPTIEGIPWDILGNYVRIPFADFSVHAVLLGLGLEPFPGWPPLTIVAALVAVWFWYSRHQPVEGLLAGLAAWYFLADLFLPAFRNSYNDVLILNLAAFALLVPGRFRFWLMAPLIFALAMGWCVYALTLTSAWMIDLPAFFFTLAAVATLFVFNNRAGSSKVAAAC